MTEKENGRMEGDIKFFNASKGFGFITNTDDGEDYFFHHSSINVENVVEGDHVTFKPTKGDKGPRAEDVKVVEQPPSMGRTNLNDASVQLQ